MDATFHGASGERPIDVGIVGLGGQGQRNQATLWQSSRFRIAWVHDRQKGRITADLGDIAVPSVSEALRARSDVVGIATPPASHFDLAYRFLRAGIGVVLEKPTTLKYVETRRLLDVAAKKQTFLLTNFNRRWDADAIAVREAVVGHDFGRIHEIESRVSDGYALGETYPGRKSWKLRAPGGGILLDWAPHLFDQLFELIADSPESLYCMAARPNRIVESGLEEQFTIHVHYPHCIATLAATWNAGLAQPRWVVYGTRAALIVDRLCDGAGTVRYRDGDDVKASLLQTLPRRSAEDEIRSLVETAWRTRQTPRREAMRMSMVSYAIDLARRSILAQRPVRWSRDQFHESYRTAGLPAG